MTWEASTFPAISEVTELDVQLGYESLGDKTRQNPGPVKSVGSSAEIVRVFIQHG